MKQIILILATTMYSAAFAQTNNLSSEAFFVQDKTLQESIRKSVADKNYTEAVLSLDEAIEIFSRLSTADQEQYKQIQVDNYYNLACYHSIAML